jgi:uncharacterized membrane protein
MDTISRYWKAVVGFIAPGAVLVGAATLSESAGGDRITQSEWVAALVACIVTAAGVAVAKNAPPAE